MGANILVIQTAFIGDALLTVPLLKNIYSTYPDAKLTILCRKGLAEIFSNTGLVETALEYDKSGTRSLNVIKQKLKKINFDVIISPHQSVRTHLLVSSLKSPLKVGYRKCWNGFVFNKRIQRPMQLPEPLRQMSLLALLNDSIKSKFEDLVSLHDFESSESKETVQFSQRSTIPDWLSMVMPKTFYSEKVFSKIDKLLVESKKFVAIAPGSVWETKKWTIDGFVALAKSIQELGFEIVYVGGPEEKSLCEQVKQQAGGVNLAGQLSLYESAHLLNRAQLIVCNDSGGMHLAALAGIPIVSVFGPTVLALGYRPWSSDSIVVQTALDCRPCGLHGSKQCPIKTHDCMQLITHQQVFSNVKKLLFD